MPKRVAPTPETGPDVKVYPGWNGPKSRLTFLDVTIQLKKLQVNWKVNTPHDKVRKCQDLVYTTRQKRQIETDM